MSSDEKTENELNDDFLNIVQDSQSSGHITEDQSESPESISERRKRLEEELNYVRALENKDKPVENPDVMSPEQFEQELIANQPHTEDEKLLVENDNDPAFKPVLFDEKGNIIKTDEKHAEDENNIGEKFNHMSLKITATRPTEEDLKEDQNQSNDVIPEEETPPWETPVAKPAITQTEQFNKLAEDAKVISDQEIPKTEKKKPGIYNTVSVAQHETKPEEIQSVNSTPKIEKKVEILDPETAEVIESQAKRPAQVESIGTEVPSDDFEDKIRKTRVEIQEENNRLTDKFEEEYNEDKLVDTIASNYDDEDTVNDEVSDDVKVEVVENNGPEKKKETNKPENKQEYSNEYRNAWHGGDGEVTSFKQKSARISKILRNVNIEDTAAVRSSDMSHLSEQERTDVYLKSVLPALQPNYIAIPLVISGVIISMTAFGWPDVREICQVDEELDELDPMDDEYTYKKNMIFLKRRRKQCDLFYKHILAVSGYKNVPPKEELFGKIIKFPDFQQLFFGAYAATFQKEYSFTIGCGTCGYDNEIKVWPKQLCFLLNKNIDLDRLNHYLSKGASLNKDNEETLQVYKEFQEEELVKQAKKTFRIKKSLPNSAFIYELKIPSIFEAYDALEEIANTYRNKDFEIIDEDGNMSTIDAAFDLTPDLIELKKYLYMSAILIPVTINNEKNAPTVQIKYERLQDTSSVINSVYKLSLEDYRTLINDPQLNNLIKCNGIQHAIKAGKCKAESCGEDMGILPVNPETLFFIIARPESNN